MNSITIITIVVVALLTVVIFGLAWLGYTSCLRMYKLEVEQGKHDKAIFQEYHGKMQHTGFPLIWGKSYFRLSLNQKLLQP